MNFDYRKAFSRNLGWVDEEEQNKIRNTVIGIPGMGGVGGHHLHSLARIGFSNFKIADFDSFDLHNLNRQIGADIDTIGKPKAEVLQNIIRKINPEAKITLFKEGVLEGNYQSFLEGLDIIVDSLDVYEIEIREKLYSQACHNKIPVLSAAPLGMGTSVMSFLPGKMSFERYFDFSPSDSHQEKMIKFVCGIAPKRLHLSYLKYPEYVDISQKKVPSLHTGVTSATSAISAICLKLTLNRGKVLAAPRGYHVDFFQNNSKRFYIPFGNRNPLQKIAISLVRKRFLKQPGNENESSRLSSS